MTEPTNDNSNAVRLVVISAGISDPSSTRLLADQLAQKSLAQFTDAGMEATLSVIDLAPLAVDIAKALIAGFPNEKLKAAIDTLAGADAVIAASPVYKAGLSGLFKSFVDLLDNDLLIAKPIILAATAGTARHAMVVDDQMRPLFAYMRALPVPTAIFAAPEDWNSPEFGGRLVRAATELTQFVRSRVGPAITGAAWDSYQHQFGSASSQRQEPAEQIDFDSDLMKLAAGGSLGGR